MSDLRWRVVTVGREYGSGGAAIGAALAQALGWRLLDRALIERISQDVSVDPGLAERLDEHVDGWAARIARALRFGPFEAVAPVAADVILDGERIAALTAAVMEEAASTGECVIVGRGAQCLLRGRADVFSVFVYAPRVERVRRLRERLGAGVEIEALMDERERERAAWVRLHYGCDRSDRSLYHLMVNAAIGEDAAVAAILAALRVS
jgi:hypothetical protein